MKNTFKKEIGEFIKSLKSKDGLHQWCNAFILSEMELLKKLNSEAIKKAKQELFDDIDTFLRDTDDICAWGNYDDYCKILKKHNLK